jgi:hypothetical protein
VTSEELAAWLKQRQPGDRCLVASRIALRALPLLTSRIARAKGSDLPGVIEVFKAAQVAWLGNGPAFHEASALASSAAEALSRSAPTLGRSSTAAWNVGGAAYIAARCVQRDLLENPEQALAYALEAEEASGRAELAASAEMAVELDAEVLDSGRDLRDAPLWLIEEPKWVAPSWERITGRLRDRHENWHVWTGWYEERLGGAPSDWDRELRRAQIGADMHRQGARVINEQIADSLGYPTDEERRPTSDEVLPLENVPSAFGFDWSEAGRLVLFASSADLPLFPSPGSERDHSKRLDTCRALAEDLVEALEAYRYNARPEYLSSLRKYLKRTPQKIGEGNILLADAEARTIRSLFSADVDCISTGLASNLKTFLEQHMGLRLFYPEI